MSAATQLAPRIQVHRFWTKITVDPKDPNVVKEDDWVEYGQVGMGDRSKTVDKVARIFNVIPSNDMQNPAILLAHMRKAAIEPAYTAWKAGRETPVNGTTLAVLNSLPQEEADYLRQHGVKVIEELAQLTDTHIERLKLRNLRVYIAEARRYLDASDTRKFSATLAEKDREIANLELAKNDQQEQIRSLMQKMDELAGMVAAQNVAKEGEAKRGPGRPRKDEAKAEQTEAA
ncbi:MAG: hypothetical protein Q8R92_09725 [Deltaproteobacteria bacterium]|nr:hypothetical protein [Deltaproteobacteria bacterium]